MEKIDDKTRGLFELLCQGIEASDVAIMLCKERATGENVPLLVLVNETEENYEFYPLGRLFTDIAEEFDNYEPLIDGIEGAEYEEVTLDTDPAA